MTATRVAVTGVGIVSALAHGAEKTFERMLAGERGFSEISLFETTGQRSRFAAEVKGFEPRALERSERAAPLSRSDALALGAARDAVRESGLTCPIAGPSRLGIAVGVTTGGMLEAEAILARFPSSIPSREAVERLVSYPISSTADRLGEVFGAPARVVTVCSACSSGASAIIQGALWITSGSADVVLAGGTDALCRLTVTGFNALGATDTVPCRPFDRERRGLTLGEGAAFLVLESEERALGRGANVVAWLTGWAAGAEAHHIAQPEPSAKVPSKLLREAMARAERGPEDIDYLNAHGTGTSNDAVEAAGIREALGAETDRVLVSSSKGQIGHTLGAAGAIEAAITALCLRRQQVPPTGGLREPDPQCRLNHVLDIGRPARLRAALSSAFGFGGAGAVLLFERVERESDAPARRSAVLRAPSRLVVTGASVIGPSGVWNWAECAEGRTSAEPRSPVVPLDQLEPSRSRRFDAQAALVTLGAEHALRSANLSPTGVGLVAGSAFGSVERTVAFLRTAIDKGERRVPPAEFPHLLPSSAPGNASIYLGLTGTVMTASGLDASTESSVLAAADILAGGMADAMIAGGIAVRDPFVRDLLGPACGAGEQGHSDGGAWLVLETEEAARRRSARVLAVLAAWGEWPSESAPLPVDPPKRRERSVVITLHDGPRAETAAAHCGWGGVPVVVVLAATGNRGGVGAGLPVACARIARGDVDEALVVGGTPTRAYAFHLVRPA